VTYISPKLRRHVEDRSQHQCEYCQMPDSLSFYSHEVDHVIATKHGGTTTLDTWPMIVGAVTATKEVTLAPSIPKVGVSAFFSIHVNKTGRIILCFRPFKFWAKPQRAERLLTCSDLTLRNV